MSVPDHLKRFPTRAAIDSLAKRFGLLNESWMQDWEYQVADPNRIDEFLAAYQSGELSDDERFVLMEILIQSFDDAPGDLNDDPRWHRLLELLGANLPLHASSICYWSLLDADEHDECWRVTPFMRSIVDKYRGVFSDEGAR